MNPIVRIDAQWWEYGDGGINVHEADAAFIAAACTALPEALDAIVDRERTHLAKTNRWTACGKRGTIVPSTHDPSRVTCEACLTHIRKVETPA